MKTSTSPAAAHFTFKTVQADGMSTMVAYRNGREHYRSCKLSHGLAARFGREYCEAKNAPFQPGDHVVDNTGPWPDYHLVTSSCRRRVRFADGGWSHPQFLDLFIGPLPADACQL